MKDGSHQEIERDTGIAGFHFCDAALARRELFGESLLREARGRSQGAECLDHTLAHVDPLHVGRGEAEKVNNAGFLPARGLESFLLRLRFLGHEQSRSRCDQRCALEVLVVLESLLATINDGRGCCSSLLRVQFQDHDVIGRDVEEQTPLVHA